MWTEVSKMKKEDIDNTLQWYEDIQNQNDFGGLKNKVLQTQKDHRECERLKITEPR